MPERDHDWYMTKLAEHERQRTEPRVVFTEFTLGPVRKKHPGRADVASLRLSWRHLTFNIFEVKATRSDFLSDVRSEKWRKYLPHCTRFYFAAPEGIVKSTELEPEAGLVVYKPDRESWYTVRHPKVKRPEEQTTELLRAMVFYLWGIEHPTEARARRIQEIYAETRRSGKALSSLLSMLGNRHVRRLQHQLEQTGKEITRGCFQQQARFRALEEHGLPKDPWELRRELKRRDNQSRELTEKLAAIQEKQREEQE